MTAAVCCDLHADLDCDTHDPFPGSRTKCFHGGRGDQPPRQRSRTLRCGNPQASPSGIIVTAATAVEVDDLVTERVGRLAARVPRRPGPRSNLLEPVDAALLHRAVELDKHYADLQLGLADGTVTAAAERYQAAAILTLDHHYRIVAPGFAIEPG